MNFLRRLGLLGLAQCVAIALQAQPAAVPKLSIQELAGDQIRLAWPSTASGFVLEQADTLAAPVSWQTIPALAPAAGADFTVTVPGSSGTRFFRLRQAAPAQLTSITGSSPADGETGVAVTRETIVHFSAPLASDTMLTTNHFYATFGGRRILSRIELAGDRSKATLFYLEPLPGSARVNVFFDSEGLKDAQGQPLDPAGSGRAGGFKVIQFDTLSLTPLTGTAVIGRVFASELTLGAAPTNRPLAGVTITVDGLEQSVRAVTDAMGNFTLTNCPAGRFFVHIDGRTVKDDAAGIRYPDRSYYPFVGKAWDAVAGRTDNKAGGTGEIFLPLITAGTLQTVSATEDTKVSFPAEVVQQNPALAGVSITVPANTLFSDNGTRGGKVGIAPVPPDRLPGPLPAGLEMPLVITVQTDGGLNFDRPAPICFPNLPDPVLKTPLPAGSKQALISFDHDKGIWEAVGSMTVSADGKMICTDPGAGILQPGWHGVGPIPDTPPPCSELCCDGPSGGPPQGFLSFREFSLQTLGKLDDNTPKRCKPCRDKYQQCIKVCDDEFKQCNDQANKFFITCVRNSNKNFDCQTQGSTNSAKCSSEVGKCESLWKELKRLCDDGQALCYHDCIQDCKPAKAKALRSKGVREEDSIAEEIDRRLAEISILIEPYLPTNSIMPVDVRTRIFAMLDEADAIAGGDAVQYLNDYAIRLEEEGLAESEDLGEDPGNAPPYPVLYAAQIDREDGTTLALRGETGPFGQYSLFVPRDGQVRYAAFYDPRTKQAGSVFPNLRPDAPHRLPRFNLRPIDSDLFEIDGDGLQSMVEFIYGTDEANPDSDGDGILDGAEIEQGTDPLDGVPVRTGIIATIKTPGAAVDVAAAGDRLAVAQGGNGVSVFNIANGLNPTLVGHLPAIGDAQRVAVASRFVAVASSDAGVRIIDAEAPRAPAVVRTFPRADAQAIAADGGVAYAGFGSGAIVALDLKTGLVRNELSVTNAVRDVALHGDYLYALTDDRLFAISLAQGQFAIAGLTNAPVSTVNQRLFVGDGIAYTVHGRGYNTFDLADPARPVLLTTGNTAQFGWKHIVANGSGLGVAVVGANTSSASDVSLYDLSNPRTNDLFLTQFNTPGTASAVSIFNGFAYAADGAAGIQVINYLAFDNKKVPPSIRISNSAALGVAESSLPLRVTASATDDVQVRNVEFYIDGERTFTDGNFPFEYRFDAPVLTATKTNITLRARAIDTGGNFTWSEEVTIKLGPDVTPPRIMTTAPLGGGKVVSRVVAYFNERMNPVTLNTASFRLSATGPDGQFDTVDDLSAGGGTVRYHAESPSVSMDFSAPLPDGLYRVVVTTAVADVSGNRMTSDYTWQFRVADAVFWSSGIDGFWEDGSNWSTGIVPGPADDIFIESIPGDVTISHGSSTRVIKRLVVGERMTLTGGTWQISGTIELHQPLILNGSTLKGGAVKENSTGKLNFLANTVNTLDGVRVEGDLELTSAGVRIRNGLTLAGSVVLDNSNIAFSGNQTFNTGQVIFAGNFATLTLDPGTTLTLGPAMVVRGKTAHIGASTGGTVKLINQGLIAADVPGGIFNLNLTSFENTGTLSVGNGAAMSFFSGTYLNTGAINVSGGGTLNLNGDWTNAGTLTMNEATVNLGGTFKPTQLGTLTRTGGAVNLTGVLDLGGGTLTLDATTGPWRLNGGTLKNGTVRQTAGAKLIFPSGATGILDGVTVEGDLELTSAGVRIRNGLTLAGSVVLDNSGIAFSGNQTFNTGQVIFAGNSAALTLDPGTTLTLGPAMVVRGKAGHIGASAGGTVKLINQGLIAADVPGGIFNLNLTQFENPGTLRADGAGATVTVRVTPFTNTGKIEELNGGRVLINP